MYKVRNNMELREAYGLIKDLKDFAYIAKTQAQRDNMRNWSDDIKRGIRRYTQRQSKRRVVEDLGVDGVTVLVELPDDVGDEQDAEEWFLENEYIERRPSAYDCTGRAFTLYHKFVRRRGRWYCYHAVRFDV